MDLVKLESSANLFLQSKLFSDVTSLSQAMIKIQAGAELGFKPMQSMQGIDIIQGKVFIKPTMLAALVKSSGKYTYKQVQSNDKLAEIEFFEIIDGKRESIGTSKFSIDDAAKMNLANRDQWKKQPANMLFYRALSQGIKHFCPDVVSMPIYSEGDSFDAPKTDKISRTEILTLKGFIQRENITQDRVKSCLAFFGCQEISELTSNDLSDFRDLLVDNNAVIIEKSEIEDD